MADFESKREAFRAIGTELVALSVDAESDARATVERHRLTYPVLYGLDAFHIRQSIGAYINEDPPYLQATGVLLRPEGTVAQAVYSSGPIGRLVASDTLGFIKHLQAESG